MTLKELAMILLSVIEKYPEHAEDVETLKNFIENTNTEKKCVELVVVKR